MRGEKMRENWKKNCVGGKDGEREGMSRGPRVSARGRIGRIIEWYVTVLCRFARNVRAVSKLMAAGQMFRGFSAKLSCPRAQHNARLPYTRVCVHICMCALRGAISTHIPVHPLMQVCRICEHREHRDMVRVHAPTAESALGNVYITCAVAALHTRLQMPV